MRKLKFLGVALVALALLVPNIGLTAEVGKPAPEFALPIFGGGSFKLADIKGKQDVVLAFTQSACTSCVRQLEFINNYVGVSDNVLILAVNVDSKGGAERWNKLMEAYVSAKNLKMQFLVDPQYTVPQLFGIRATPGYAVIDKEGILLTAVTGFIQAEDGEYLSKMIDSLK